MTVPHANNTPSAAAPGPQAGERSEAAGGAGAAAADTSPPPSPHVKAKRRHFTAQDKLRILERADAATEPGHIALLLRQEGIYSSHLTDWRRWREKLENPDAAPGKRETAADLRRQLEEARRENRRLTKKLDQSQLLIELQKKVLTTTDAPAPGGNDGRPQ